MPIPPQFLKNIKHKKPGHLKPGNAAEDKLDGGKDDAIETARHAAVKKLASKKKG